MAVVRDALDGLAARQRIIAQNIANAETPGYRAGVVNFEDSLRSAIASGRPAEFSINTAVSTATPGFNGNNVQLDEENVSLIDSGLRYQMMSEAMNAKFAILRTSLRRDN